MNKILATLWTKALTYRVITITVPLASSYREKCPKTDNLYNGGQLSVFSIMVVVDRYNVISITLLHEKYVQIYGCVHMKLFG